MSSDQVRTATARIPAVGALDRDSRGGRRLLFAAVSGRAHDRVGDEAPLRRLGRRRVLCHERDR
jgi:hypothetical protein